MNTPHPIDAYLINAQPPAANPANLPVSPLVLADRLIGLAQDADRAGLRRPAGRLVRLACEICDEQPVFNAVWPAGVLPSA